MPPPLPRAGVAVLAALAPAVAIAVDPGGWFPFGPVKWLVVSSLVPVGAALVLARRPVRVAPVPTVAAGVLLVWMAVAAALGSDPTYAWTGTPERHFGVLTWGLCWLSFVVGQSMDSDGDGRWVLIGLTAAGLGVGVLTTAEALGFEPAVFDVGGRLTGSFGSSAYLGAATALLLPVCVAVALARETSRGLRTAAALGAVTLAVALVGSGARAAWVGVAASALAALWTRRQQIAARGRPAVVVGAAALMAVTAVALFTPAGARIASTFDEDASGGRGRLDEWRVAARVATEHALVGVGPEGYRIAFGGAADASYERAHGREPLPDRAHAAPLDIAVTGGLPALAAWTVLMVVVVRAALRALAGGRAWLAGSGAAVIAYVVAELLLFPLAELEPIVFIVAGVVVASDRAGQPRTVVVPRVVPVLVGAVGGLALLFGGLDIAADRRAADAATALGRGETSAAVIAAAAAADLRPDEVRLHLLHARALVGAERGTLVAIEAVDDALAVSPGDPIALLDRLELLVARAEATLVPAHAIDARSEAERLLADDPHNAALWLQAGLAARVAGNDDAAIDAWEQAEFLAPRSPAASTNIALLHLERGEIDDARRAVERALERAPGDRHARDVLALVERAE